MNTDVFLVFGLIIIAFAVPPTLGAFFDSRAPRTPAILILIGGSLVVLAVTQNPGGYSIYDVPDVFVRVIGQFFR